VIWNLELFGETRSLRVFKAFETRRKLRESA
jgi:hypothetical protein